MCLSQFGKTHQMLGEISGKHECYLGCLLMVYSQSGKRHGQHRPPANSESSIWIPFSNLTSLFYEIHTLVHRKHENQPRDWVDLHLWTSSEGSALNASIWRHCKMLLHAKLCMAKDPLRWQMTNGAWYEAKFFGCILWLSRCTVWQSHFARGRQQRKMLVSAFIWCRTA